MLKKIARFFFNQKLLQFCPARLSTNLVEEMLNLCDIIQQEVNYNFFLLLSVRAKSNCWFMQLL